MNEPETTVERRFVWPAEYYSAPTPPAVLPTWAVYGCGAAAVLTLIVVFVGGAWLASGGLSQFMDMAMGMSVAEMKGLYAADVPAARKESLAREIETMRQNVRDEKVSLTRMRDFFQSMSEAIADRKVTNAEATALERSAHLVNAGAQRR